MHSAILEDSFALWLELTLGPELRFFTQDQIFLVVIPKLPVLD